MAEMVVEQIEIEAPAEEVFDFWSDADNFCAFIANAEESRRVDLSRSRWLLEGPEGRSIEYEPEYFSHCLADHRNRLAHGIPSRGNETELDAILNLVKLEFKRRSEDRTLLLLTYLADRAERFGDDAPQVDDVLTDALSARYRVYLDLHVIFSHLFNERRSGTPVERAGRPSRESDPREEPAGDRVISLLEEWAAEDAGYDEETLPALEEAIDRNRPEYRKLFGRG